MRVLGSEKLSEPLWFEQNAAVVVPDCAGLSFCYIKVDCSMLVYYSKSYCSVSRWDTVSHFSAIAY